MSQIENRPFLDSFSPAERVERCLRRMDNYVRASEIEEVHLQAGWIRTKRADGTGVRIPIPPQHRAELCAALVSYYRSRALFISASQIAAQLEPAPAAAPAPPVSEPEEEEEKEEEETAPLAATASPYFRALAAAAAAPAATCTRPGCGHPADPGYPVAKLCSRCWREWFRCETHHRTAGLAAFSASPTTSTDEGAPAMPEPTKPESPTLADSAKAFGSTVAYRTAAMQLTKRARGLLADALTQHLKGKARTAKRRVILDLLDGPVGDPLVALLLSGVLPQVAGLVNQRGPKVDRLAEELRLHAGVVVANEVMDGLFSLIGPAKDALSQALSGLPDGGALPQESGGRCDVIDMRTERARAGATT